MADVVVRPPSHPKINATEVAVKYANDVLSGKIIAGILVKLAVKRFLRDIKTGPARGLIFRQEEAQRVVDFFGFLHHSKGEWGGQVFVLAPWQVFVLANMFGWYRADGTRRYREAYIEIARKNGKSTFLAGIGLYMLLADDEPGAEVYSAATKKDQAKIVFDESCRMRKASPFLASRIQEFRNNLSVLASNSKFEPLSADDNTLDGLNIHCGLIDELHAHPDRKLYDVLYEATASRRQPLIISITTAGYNRQGICYKQREYGEKILVGNVAAKESDAFFAFIACLDEKDNWADEAVWGKANPSLGISVKIDKLREAAAKAKEDPTALNSFLRKHLNVWTSQDIRWMPPEKWAACNSAGPLQDAKQLRAAALEKLKGRFCFGGLDLSSKIDLSAFGLVFPPVPAQTETRYVEKRDPQTPWKVDRIPEEVIIREADPLWHLLVWLWMPADNVEDRVKKDRVQYDTWIREGFVEATKGNTVDQATIRAAINKLRADYQIEEIGFDSWNATQMAQQLIEDGLNLVEVRQGYKTMSEPMKEFMALVLSRKCEHYGNPALTWMVDNVAAEQDPAGNIKPDKERSKEKIDGVVALLNAMHRIVQNPSAASQESVYARRGIVFL